MAWPSEAGSIAGARSRRRRAAPRKRSRSGVVSPVAFLGRFYLEARGRYRVFNAAEYRFYRDNAAAPDEGDAAFDTNATLPHEPTDTHADGTWRESLAYFNGVISSGFRPLGEQGETFVRLDLSGGAATVAPPYAPEDVRLELRAGGVVRVHATYNQGAGALRANTWAIAYTFDGSTPAADAPDAEPAIVDGVAILELDLAAQADTTTVKVRVQVQRTGDSVFSEGSSVLQATADAAGPSAPSGSSVWPGRTPEAL